MRRKSIQVLCCTAALALLCGCAQDEVAEETTAAVAVSTTQPVVETYATTGTYLASLEPQSRVTVMPLLSGEIETVDVTLGDAISEGDLLCTLDTEDIIDQCETLDTTVARVQTSYNAIADGLLVKAPVSGYIYSIDTSLGYAVGATDQLAYLSNQQSMTIELPFLDALVSDSWMGTAATLSLVDTGEQLSGTVTDISGTTAFLYETIQVRYVTITVNTPGALSVGRSATATVNGTTCSDSGVFSNAESSPVYSGLSGYVDAIYVSNGQYVTAGTSMFRVTNTSTLLQLSNGADSVQDAIDARDDMYEILEDYTVTAPISGTISAVYVQPLDIISASSPVMEISTTDRMEISFSVPQSTVNHLFVGESFDVTTGQGTATGTVSQVSTVADATSGLFVVKGLVEGDGTAMLSGTTAQVELKTYAKEDAMIIPYDAVQFVGSNAYVYQVVDNYTVQVPIEIEKYDSTRILVASGLSSTDTIVATWSAQLRDGLLVEEVATYAAD
ncbi:MAG: efflux RND transporter periplasmic adaptor subunit [Eubacteriales bacterium]